MDERRREDEGVAAAQKHSIDKNVQRIPCDELGQCLSNDIVVIKNGRKRSFFFVQPR